ncbi:DUF3488 domain-containing protein [Nocardiopsis sp. NPDC006938]|uniref:DUF3488 domain-containing protein n=1 Tax=Nocardiopsis sp. NPDC006938 TaxID=3364337 RepID=UPI0036BA6D50
MDQPGSGPYRGDDADGGEADDPAPTEEEVAPADLVLERELPDLFARVAGVYARHLGALLVVSGVPLAPLVLAAQLHVVWPAREGAYLDGALESTADPTGGPALVILAGLAVLALLLAPISIGGSVLLGGGALLGRRISVRDAWRCALRRYPTTLAWTLALLAVVGAAAALALRMLSWEWPVLLVATVVLPPTLFVLTPLSVALPAALLEGRGPVRGLVLAWRVGRHRWRTHMALVGAALGVSVLFGPVLERSLLRWSGWSEGDLVLVGVTTAASVLAAPLSLLLICAPAVYAGVPAHWYITPPALDLARVGRSLPAADAARSGAPRVRARHLVTAPSLAVLLVVPALLGPAALTANPFGLPELTTSPLPTVTGDVQTVEIAATEEGALVGAAHSSVLVERCAPDCEVVVDAWGADRGAGFSVEDGRLLRTHWRTWAHDRILTRDEEVRHEVGLYLAVCEDALDCDTDADEVYLRPVVTDLHQARSTVAPLASGGLVVASYTVPDDRIDPDEAFDGDVGGLRLHVCAQDTCADPRVLDLTEGGAARLEVSHLDASTSPGGGFAVAVADAAYGALSLVTCADDDCSDPEVTELVGDRFRTENEHDLTARYGARVEHRSDGSPVVAYRDAVSGEARVVDCRDAECSEFTDTAVTGPGWSRPVPGLAVDSRDQVRLLTPGLRDERLTLVTCLDRPCAETDTRPLIDLGFQEGPVVTALALDSRDRPHMVWGVGWWTEGHGPTNATSRYLTCADPDCGTSPATP